MRTVFMDKKHKDCSGCTIAYPCNDHAVLDLLEWYCLTEATHN